MLSASAPTSTSGPAVYRTTLADGTATVRPVFFDNTPATVANVHSSQYGMTIPLALTDPDSNTVVPPQSPRFAGDFVLTSQGDQQQVYVKGANGPRPQLMLLNLSQSINDTAFATDSTGTLFVTDGADNEVFTVRGNFTPGMALVVATPSSANNPINRPNYLATLNLRTGHVAPYVTTIQAGGLLFVP